MLKKRIFSAGLGVLVWFLSTGVLASFPVSADRTNASMGSFIYTTGGSYRLTNYFGLEGGYTRFPDVKPTGTQVTKDNNMIAIAAKGMLPFQSGFNFFGKLGVVRVGSEFAAGVLNGSMDETSIATVRNRILPYMGGGVGYTVAPKVDFTAQLSGTPSSGDVPSMYALMGGLSYQF